MLGPANRRDCSSVLLCLGCWNGRMVGFLHVGMLLVEVAAGL